MIEKVETYKIEKTINFIVPDDNNSATVNEFETEWMDEDAIRNKPDITVQKCSMRQGYEIRAYPNIIEATSIGVFVRATFHFEIDTEKIVDADIVYDPLKTETCYRNDQRKVVRLAKPLAVSFKLEDDYLEDLRGSGAFRRF